ncbi:YbaY family lipoprotein [Pseudomonas stutzeri]|uniref:YbaY family lipoprotein n=1 Tax=Stutzerimonas stutzeri TaxID=316 RepID=UPI0021086149|nr:YbaY family lipoprotein [Stutzerimonas stutzeri]
MRLRPFVLPALLLLLAGCSSQEAQRPTAPVTFEDPPRATTPMHELHGSLIGVPADSEVELALLEVNRRDQPDRLLSNVKLKGRGGELPFILKFNAENFPKDQQVELRGRVTRSGQLIMRLPAVLVSSPASQSLGPLRLVPAP